MDEQREAGTSSPARERVAASLALFLAGFVLTAAVLYVASRWAIPDKLRLHADIRSEKLAVMDAWQGRAVSAMFGSSHVHDGFDPRAFDAALAGTPLATRSLNAGVAGGSEAEERVMALDFLRRLRMPVAADGAKAPRACFVLLEATAGANFTYKNLLHPRAISIYDWKTMRFVSRLTDATMSLQRRIGRVGYAVVTMALHYANVGMWSDRIFPAPLNQEYIEQETRDDRRGLEAAETTPARRRDVAAEFARQPQVSEPSPQALLPGELDLLQELQAASAVRNVQVLYIAMPSITDLRLRPVYPTSVAGPHGAEPVLNLARPDFYPELYQVRYWDDRTHLNEAGAALASRLLAEQIKAWYSANPDSARCGG